MASSSRIDDGIGPDPLRHGADDDPQVEARIEPNYTAMSGQGKPGFAPGDGRKDGEDRHERQIPPAPGRAMRMIGKNGRSA